MPETLYDDQIVAEPCPVHARPYQQACVDAVYRQWDGGARATLCQLPTGTGKTVCAALIARKFPQHRGRVLVLANRDELILQWEEEMRRVCNNDQVEVEHGQRRASRNKRSMRRDEQGRRRAAARIVVASKDTLWRDHRLKTFEEDEFGLVVVDECSQWQPDNPTWHNIIEYFRGASVVGFDATPVRSDGKPMGAVFDSVACEYSVVDAVGDGWLVQPIQQYVMVEDFDLSGLRSVKGKDWSEKELNRVWNQEKPLQALAQQTVDYAVFEGAKKRPGHVLSTLVFNNSVETARHLADILNRRHARDGTGRAAVVSSKDTDPDERRRIFDGFEEGRIRYLCNYGIATRGYDNPSIEMVVLARPTKFAGLMVQMVGRGLRPLRECVPQLNKASSSAARRGILESSAKGSCLFLDPIGTTGVHSLACDLVDILGDGYDRDFRYEVKCRLVQSDGKFKAEDLEKAKRALDAERAEFARRRDFVVDSTHVGRAIDPFDADDPRRSTPSKVPAGGKGDEPATPGMVAYLRKRRVPESDLEGLTKRAAGRLIGEIKRRDKGGLASVGQVKLLINKGLAQSVAERLTRKEADELIERTKANGWRLPRGDAYEG